MASRQRTASCFIHCVTVAIYAVALPTWAAEFFVDPNGSDSASGAAGAPWQTLQYAAGQVNAGDRVVVRAGNYTGFHLTTSGTAGNPIEFFAEPGVLVFQQNGVTPDGINIEGASHVVVDGFNVSNMPRAGIRAVGGAGNHSQNVTIRNVWAVDNFRWGIFTGFVDDLLIENNRSTGATDEHGIYVSNSGDRPVIRGNEIWDNNANGIHMNGDASLGGDGVISHAVVEANVIYGNGVGGGSGINMDGVIDSRIQNNLIFDTHASGISLYQIDGGAPSTGNIVVNNTVHVASDGRWALNIQNGATGNTVYNNFLLNEHSFRGALDISPDSLPGFTSDHNVVISRFTADDAASVLSLGGWQTFSGQDANSQVGDPNQLFFDWTTGDYDLTATSLGLDAGTSLLAPPIDLEGKPRPVGAGFDVGAIERGLFSADFDTDGDVDGDDLARWEASYAIDDLADADDDSDSDGLDFLAWQTQYTGAYVAAVSSATSVPEPGAFVLATLAGWGLLWQRRNGQRAD